MPSISVIAAWRGARGPLVPTPLSMPSAASIARTRRCISPRSCDGQGNAVTGAPLTLVVERPDGVEFRRAVLPDQGAGGRFLAVILNSAVPSGTWRVRAFVDPK